MWPPIGDRDASETAVPAAASDTSAGAEAGQGTVDQTATHDDDVSQADGPAQERLPGDDRTAQPAPDARTHAPTPHAFPAPTASGDGCRIAVVQAEFNAEITDMMADLAISHARKAGAEVTHHAKVPGVYDLPLSVQRLARRDDVDAVVVIGCVVQGETRHDELITHATAKTLQEVSLATETPIGLGIIGPGMTWEQAEARVVNGKHAVEAALAQWQALRRQ